MRFAPKASTPSQKFSELRRTVFKIGLKPRQQLHDHLLPANRQRRSCYCESRTGKPGQDPASRDNRRRSAQSATARARGSLPAPPRRGRLARGFLMPQAAMTCFAKARRTIFSSGSRSIWAAWLVSRSGPRITWPVHRFAGKERVMALRRGFSSILKTGLRGSEDFRKGSKPLGRSASRAFAEDDSWRGD